MVRQLPGLGETVEWSEPPRRPGGNDERELASGGVFRPDATGRFPVWGWDGTHSSDRMFTAALTDEGLVVCGEVPPGVVPAAQVRAADVPGLSIERTVPVKNPRVRGILAEMLAEQPVKPNAQVHVGPDPATWPRSFRLGEPGTLLCDGCDQMVPEVWASDDGRALFCETCLPLANLVDHPVTGAEGALQAVLRVLADHGHRISQDEGEDGLAVALLDALEPFVTRGRHVAADRPVDAQALATWAKPRDPQHLATPEAHPEDLAAALAERDALRHELDRQNATSAGVVLTGEQLTTWGSCTRADAIAQAEASHAKVAELFDAVDSLRDQLAAAQERIEDQVQALSAQRIHLEQLEQIRALPWELGWRTTFASFHNPVGTVLPDSRFIDGRVQLDPERYERVGRLPTWQVVPGV